MIAASANSEPNSTRRVCHDDTEAIRYRARDRTSYGRNEWLCHFYTTVAKWISGASKLHTYS